MGGRSSEVGFFRSEETLENWKHAWLILLRQHGPKAARYSNCDSEKLYTALYRADKRWLLQVNHQHRVQRKGDLIRVSWQKQDGETWGRGRGCGGGVGAVGGGGLKNRSK